MKLTRRRLIMAAAAAPFCAVSHAAVDPGVPPADRELRVPVKGGSLYVRVNGEMNPKKHPLLLVHGGPGGALWQFFPALPLASERAIILYDQLDSGRSDAPGDKANWTVDRFVSEIDAVRAALDLKKVHLLGHSWGGILANRYAAQRPAGLRSLILQGAPLSANRAEASIKSLYDELPDGAGAIVQSHERAGTLDDPDYRKAMVMFMRKHLNRTSVRDVAMPYMAPTPEDRGDAVAAAMTGGKLGSFEGALKGFNDEPLLKRIAVPTLLLRGEFDIMTAAATRAVLPMLKHGSFGEIPGAGHMAQFDQPDAWRRVVRDFIGKLDA